MSDQTDALVRDFQSLDTTSISDALDRLGVKGCCVGITPRIQGTKSVGRAFTVRYRPCGIEKGTVGDFLDDVAPGQIVVIDNGGRTYGTVWGDLMTVYAQMRKIAGTVIDGVCRDMPRIYELKYAIYTRGFTMTTGKDRVEVDGVNVPVSISDVQVCPHDIVVCDDTGVVVVPQAIAGDVLQVAREVEDREHTILKMIETGMTMREARRQNGYHHLQSKR